DSFRGCAHMATRGSGGPAQLTVTPMAAPTPASTALATPPLHDALPISSMASSSCISSSSATSDGSTSCSTLFFIGDSFLSLLCTAGAHRLGRRAPGDVVARVRLDADERSASHGTADRRRPRRLHGFQFL